MYKYVLGCLVFLIFLTGCKEEAKEGESKFKEINKLEESFKRVFYDGDYNYQVEYNNRLDTSYLDVLYKGKKVHRYGFTGRIINEFLADINSDKKNEVYVVAERNSKVQLYVYNIEEGKTIEIVKETIKDESNIGTKAYEIERNQLVERYDVKGEDGKVVRRILRYNLVNRDGSLVLLPQGWHSKKLERMAGQYAARDAIGAGYYKVMVLKDNGGGVWNVDIKVKRNGDKKILCDFIGKGYFLNEDLIVPLGDVNPDLKGTLKIRFLDLMAAVYTEDPLDSKDMISFCEGVGSIAGNFKKTNI